MNTGMREWGRRSRPAETGMEALPPPRLPCRTLVPRIDPRPAAVVGALRDELAAATMEPEVKAQLLTIGLEPEVSTPAELGRILAEDIERWRPVVERSGFKVD